MQTDTDPGLPSRDERMAQLARIGDQIVGRILFGEARVDIDIAIARMRDTCEDWFPDRMDLFQMVYEGRFDRIWEQFRAGE